MHYRERSKDCGVVRTPPARTTFTTAWQARMIGSTPSSATVLCALSVSSRFLSFGELPHEEILPGSRAASTTCLSILELILAKRTLRPHSLATSRTISTSQFECELAPAPPASDDHWDSARNPARETLFTAVRPVKGRLQGDKVGTGSLEPASTAIT